MRPLIATALATLLAACGEPAAPMGDRDAGARRDSGTVADAGETDTGVQWDASVRDSGPPRDAGPPPRDAGPLPNPPTTLAETGFDDPGVRTYVPRYPLWSDGAAKQRFVFLPEGTQIDTSNQDRWTFPVGTKFWKTFVRDGVRVETRLLEKVRAPDGWLMVAYAWNEAQDEAVATPDGAMNHLGTEHDVPTARDCGSCHFGIEDRVLGFGAIQLEAATGSVSLSSLIAEDRLTHPPTTSLEAPGDKLDRDVLTYLHANCGTCHNATTVAARPDFPKIEFWLTSDSLARVEDTPTYQTTFDVRTVAAQIPGIDADRVLAPGDHAHSMMWVRMTLRGFGSNGMPPWFATEVVDEAATASVAAFIDRLSR